MPEKFTEDVTITETGGKHQTIVSATSLLVGHSSTGATRAGPIHGGFGTHIDPGGQVVVGDNAPAVPAVSLEVGDKGASGGLVIRDSNDEAAMSLNGASGLATIGSAHGRAGTVVLRSGKNGPVILITGQDGRITFFDDRLRTTLVIDGVRGDIDLLGADCAEDFDVQEETLPGSVMCLGEDEKLRTCSVPYDRMVAGVISGAGAWRPALRLDRQRVERPRAPLALAGKVNCLVDASHGPIRIGDLLTTSQTRGHAMRAADPRRAFGAVFGKSLGRLDDGCGLVPVLVSLH